MKIQPLFLSLKSDKHLCWLLYLDFGAKLQATCFCSSHVDHTYLKAWTTTSTSSKFSGGHPAGAWYFYEQLGCISTLSGMYRNLFCDFRSIWTPKLWQIWFQIFETSICIWKYLKTLSGEWYKWLLQTKSWPKSQAATKSAENVDLFGSQLERRVWEPFLSGFKVSNESHLWELQKDNSSGSCLQRFPGTWNERWCHWWMIDGWLLIIIDDE